MHRFASREYSPSTRFTAVLATLLVLMLSVFAASPELHTWLHAHESSANSASGNDHQLPGQDDSGCAVTMFMTGVLVATMLVLVAGFRLFRGFLRANPPEISCALRRYWLPPLCGPPLG